MKSEYEVDLAGMSHKANMGIRPNRSKPQKKSCPEGTYILEAYTHESALVASGECHILIQDEAAFRGLLQKELEALAKWVNTENGIIGHIKAGVEYTCTEMLSVTDTEVQEKKGACIRVHCNVAAIVFGIDVGELKEQLGILFRSLCAFAA